MQSLVQRALMASALASSLALAHSGARAAEPGNSVAAPHSAAAIRYAAFDRGPAPSSLPIRNMQIVLRIDAGQRQALQAFIADRQNPRSPGFHRWLTPDQFGAQFGAAQQATARVAAWLHTAGMTDVRVARGRLLVSFSGTADTVQRALQCRIHVFEVNGKSHFANLDSPQIPSELSDAVAQVVGLDDFTAVPQSVRAPLSQYVTAGAGNALGPDDLATIYNAAPLYARGIDGSGVTVAVLGQTPVGLTDYRAYRQLFGLAVNDYQTAEFPGSGSGTGNSDDQLEATLDLEAIGAIARGAKIFYIWGSTVEVAAIYAIDNQLAQIVSLSYAGCETGGDSFYQMLALQASAEGMTWIAAAGDSGAAGCDAMGAQTASFGLSVMVPASAPNVTAVGGTAFATGASGQYWSPANNASNASALGYVPESGWSSTTQVLGGGGGVSALFAKPGFQSDFAPAVNSGRMVPDVALAAAPAPVPYVIVYNGSQMLVGGTSAAAPVFAGIAALVEAYLPAQQYPTQPSAPAGLGNINPTLYLLAEQAPWVFHDVTTGTNNVPCAIGTTDCATGTLGYAAGPGYDLATGLGSVDAYALAANWTSAVLETSSTSLAVSSGATQAQQSVSITAAVTAGGAPLAASPVEFYYSNPQYQACQTILGGAVTDAAGHAILATNLLPSGTNTIVAASTGMTQVAPSPASNAVTVGVTVFPTAIAVAPASGPYQAGQTVSLSVSVTGPSGTALAGPASANPAAVNAFFAPGTVSLTDSAGNVDATAALSASGAAVLTTPALAAGVNDFSVSYSGSAYAAPSQSAAVVLSADAPPADFALSSTGAVSLTAGSSAVATLTITPLHGFNQPIQLSCAGLPAGYTCLLPATVEPAGTTCATVTFAAPATLASAVPFAFLCLLVAVAGKRFRRIAAAGAVLVALTLIAGCAGAVSGSGSSTQNSHGYLAVITASSGAISHQLTIQVTVTQ